MFQHIMCTIIRPLRVLLTKFVILHVVEKHTHTHTEAHAHTQFNMHVFSEDP